MDKEASRPLANVFTPSEREERHECAACFETSPFDVSYTRTGEYRGFWYQILFDHNGQLVNGSVGRYERDQDRWAVLTDVDALTDERSWRIVNRKTSLSIWMAASGKPVFGCLGRADFPGRSFGVRVDSNEAITFSSRTGACFYGKIALLFGQLMNGDEVITRGYEWPYDFPEDIKTEATAFRHAHALFEHMYRLVAKGIEVDSS